MHSAIRITSLVLTVSYCFATTPSSADRDYHTFKDRQFAAFNAHYKQLRAERVARAVALGKRVFQLESQGRPTACAHQILNEIKWLIGDTADFPRIDGRLDALQDLLSHPERESLATQQDPADGSWGRCYTEWFFKLDATYDHLNRKSSRNLHPKFPLRFLDRVNSPKKLRDYFDAVSTSDIARYGLDHSRELNESMADLMRFIIRGRPAGYRWKPGIKATLMDLLLHRLRNPATGWWGERYLSNGKVEFVDNLSLTFHIVRYLDGKVADMQKVVATTLALKDRDDPAGWLDSGHYTDHNNMDVAVLFKYGRNSATDLQRREITATLAMLLHWCLADSLQPDGSFRITESSSSMEEATYFGVAFLARIGYFDKSRRFWTKQDFPEAAGARRRIVAYIEQHRRNGAAGGTYYEGALNEMGVDPNGQSHSK